MSISEFLKLRNAIFFLLKSKPTHKLKVQIKPSFILKLLTCVSGHSYFLENAVKTALNLCSWLFETKRVNEH